MVQMNTNKLVTVLVLTVSLQPINLPKIESLISPYHLFQIKMIRNQLPPKKNYDLDPHNKNNNGDLKNTYTKSILEQPENEGLLEIQVADRGAWCECA